MFHSTSSAAAAAAAAAGDAVPAVDARIAPDLAAAAAAVFLAEVKPLVQLCCLKPAGMLLPAVTDWLVPLPLKSS